MNIAYEQIEAAAKQLAATMDYPWEHMPADGRQRMRINAATILAAAFTGADQPHQDERCPVCGEDEPFTGTCGAGDNMRALCKRPAKPAQPVALSALTDIQAILFQCDRGNVSLPWLIDALRGIVERAASAPAQQAPTLKNFSVSREWLAEKLEKHDDADAAAGQTNPQAPCKTYPGCNGSNCLGCGEATPPQPVSLEDIEKYRMQMAGIMTAALGYWKEGDAIHPDYDTVALRDVAKLYAKYDALFQEREKATAPQPVAAEPNQDWWNELISDVSAIDCRYRGDPSYDHDAYWMRAHVTKMLEKRRDAK